jgi:hypothetical protein
MEQVVFFGPDKGLLGILSPGETGGDLCCLLANAGVIHRIGPHRINVKLARVLEGEGIASIRFDLSGLGDSRAAASSVAYTEQSVLDLRAAMDFAEREHGFKRFLIFGICSGAVNAHRAALDDPRVAGLFLLDGYWYTTRWTRPVLLWSRLRAHSFKSLLGKVLRKLSGGKKREAATGEFKKVEMFPTDNSGNLPKAQFAAEMNAMTARGVDVFFLYSGSVDDIVSYENQLRDAFRGEDFIRRVRIERHADVDHTAMTQHSQRTIERLVREWAARIARRGG